jgi:hypothetical protein
MQLGSFIDRRDDNQGTNDPSMEEAVVAAVPT